MGNTKISKTLNRQDFIKFLRIIKLLENSCNDCDIKNGRIRQKTNDGMAIIDMDLTPLLGNDCDLSLAQLKQKIQLLCIFETEDQDVEEGNESSSQDNVKIIIGDKDYIVMDDISEMTYRIPIKKYLNNTYINDSKVIKSLETSENDMLMVYTVPGFLCRRIKNICEGFNNDTLTCTMEDDTATFTISTVNKENKANIVKNIELNMVDVKKCTFNVQAFPFILDSGSEVEIEVYKISNKKQVLIKFYQRYFGINIVIYSRSVLT